jgi:hypothetical protein
LADIKGAPKGHLRQQYDVIVYPTVGSTAQRRR